MILLIPKTKKYFLYNNKIKKKRNRKDKIISYTQYIICGHILLPHNENINGKIFLHNFFFFLCVYWMWFQYIDCINNKKEYYRKHHQQKKKFIYFLLTFGKNIRKYCFSARHTLWHDIWKWINTKEYIKLIEGFGKV